MAITGMGRSKQIGPQGRKHLPVSAQGVDIPIGNAAFKVGGQIVQILSALGAAERVSGFMANRTKRSQRRNRNAPDYFVGRPGNGTGPRGIWQRVGSGARPILIFVKRPTYRRRFDFYGVANRVAQAEFEPLFRRALAREMERS